MGSWLFGNKGSVNKPQPASAALRLQTSIQGRPLPIFWGQARLAGNLIWYGDYHAVAYLQASPGGGGGGKGGSAGGGGKGQQGSVAYNYFVSVAIALSQGAIAEVLQAWNNKAVGTAASFGFTTFAGGYAQAAWGYLTTNHPTEALTYRGVAYLAQSSMSLGSGTELPNFSFEPRATISNAVAAFPDADAKDVWVDFLTNAYYGVGFPSARLDLALTQYSNYGRATGLLVSPVIAEQKEASAFMAELLQMTNSSARWSGGILTVVPWGDANVTGNGVTYVASVTPIYDIDDDDLLPNKGGNGEQPITVRRKRQTDMLNAVKLEYLDRVNNYDPAAIDAKDQASIDTYGLRASDVRQAHMFCRADAAVLSATLQLNREQIANEYTFTLGPQFILPDVEDLLTLTRSAMGMDRVAVRITEIKENDDGSLTFTAEDFLGTASAPLYGAQAASGHTTNTNVDPGAINAPIIFEPTAELLGGADLQIWGAISGVDTTLWGGANIYASFDGETYAQQGTVRGPARMGVLTAPLPSVTANATGQTVDTTSTLAVNLAQSAGVLASGTATDVLALATACYVDGEIVAYRDATLTTANNYNLTYLVRGGYGTETQIATHATGSSFARLDQGIFKVPFDQNRIGQTIYLKFQSFNIWGGGLQELSDLAAYPYIITGNALKSPLPVVANVRTQFTDGFQYIYWDDVTDFRTGVRYKIFKGPTYAGAQQVGDNAHAPFVAFGEGTYWIVAYCQPIPALYVYSEDPVSISISGNMLVKNLVYTSDQQAAGWPGIFSNGVGRSGDNIALGGGGDILGASDFLNIPDVLNYGGVIASGTYEVAPENYVNATWVGTGQPRGQDVLTMTDFLNQPDILGAASTQYINVKVQIATAVGTVGDLYDSTDLYTETDLYTQGIAWTDWVDYVPGVYRTQWVKFRLLLTTVDSDTIALALAFSYEVSVPPRIDHYPGNTVTTGGLTITFEPDDASAAKPFNGGPPVGGVANQPLPFINFSWSGNADASPVVDTLSLSTLIFHFVDSSGSNVAVTGVNVTAEGY